MARAPSITLPTIFPASLSLSADPRAWPAYLTTLTLHARLVHLYLSHLLAMLSVHPGLPPRLRPCAAAPPPDLVVPKQLLPLHAAVHAWLHAWAMYAEAHWRTPAEIAADNWNWATQFARRPCRAPAGREAEWPYRIRPTPPGFVRVAWYFDVKEALVPYAQEHATMYVHLPLEPDGSLRIGDVRREWGMENMCFVEWGPYRICLWPSMDGEMLSAVTVRHLLSTKEQDPFLRVIEQPTPQREKIRALRQHLIHPHTSPAHMRLYLGARHALFRTVKAYHDFARPFLACNTFALPLDQRRRIANMLLMLLLSLAALTLWLCATAVAPLFVYTASAVVAWGRSERELVRAVTCAWTAFCAVLAFVFWMLTLPLRGPLSLLVLPLYVPVWLLMLPLWGMGVFGGFFYCIGFKVRSSVSWVLANRRRRRQEGWDVRLVVGFVREVWADIVLCW